MPAYGANCRRGVLHVRPIELAVSPAVVTLPGPRYDTWMRFRAVHGPSTANPT